MHDNHQRHCSSLVYVSSYYGQQKSTYLSRLSEYYMLRKYTRCEEKVSDDFSWTKGQKKPLECPVANKSILLYSDQGTMTQSYPITLYALRFQGFQLCAMTAFLCPLRNFNLEIPICRSLRFSCTFIGKINQTQLLP